MLCLDGLLAPTTGTSSLNSDEVICGQLGEWEDVTGAMSSEDPHVKLERELVHLLEEKFPEITVKVGYSERWGRTALTFRWGGFDELLPEERFHRLFHHLPEGFYEERLRGCVWVELGSEESVEAFLKLPRSADMEAKEPRIIQKLVKARFFDHLANELGDEPTDACKGDFSTARRVLSAKRLAKTALQDALLVLMRNGAFCDCEALFNAKLLTLRTGQP